MAILFNKDYWDWAKFVESYFRI